MDDSTLHNELNDDHFPIPPVEEAWSQMNLKLDAEIPVGPGESYAIQNTIKLLRWSLAAMFGIVGVWFALGRPRSLGINPGNLPGHSVVWAGKSSDKHLHQKPNSKMSDTIGFSHYYSVEGVLSNHGQDKNYPISGKKELRSNSNNGTKERSKNKNNEFPDLTISDKKSIKNDGRIKSALKKNMVGNELQFKRIGPETSSGLIGRNKKDMKVKNPSVIKFSALSGSRLHSENDKLKNEKLANGKSWTSNGMAKTHVKAAEMAIVDAADKKERSWPLVVNHLLGTINYIPKDFKDTHKPIVAGESEKKENSRKGWFSMGLQELAVLPLQGSSDYFKNSSGTGSSYKSFIPGMWIQYSGHHYSLIAEANIFYGFTLPDVSYKAKDSMVYGGGFPGSDTSQLHITSTLVKVFGTSFGLSYCRNFSKHLSAATTIKLNLVSGGITNISTANKSTGLITSNIGSTSSSDMQLFNKVLINVGVGGYYSVNRLSIGGRLFVPVNKFAIGSSGPQHILNAEVFVKWRLLGK